MWEERYRACDGFVFGTEPAVVLTDNPWLTEGCQTALCVADGEGRNAVYLAGRGLAVASFDPAPTAVERSRALAARRGVEVESHVAGWDDWDWSRQFDLVAAIFVQFADPAFRQRQFADLAKATRPGGRLVVHGYRPEQIAFGTGGPRDPAHLYTAEMLADAFAGWKIERLAPYERVLDEGKGHSGQSALIDLVATRP